MNNDLISRSYLKNLPFERVIHTDFGDTAIPIEEIDNAPTVEDRTSEVLSLQETIRKLTTAIEENAIPQGEWIAQGKEYIECDNCNTWFKKRYLPYGNYCCKCGAKMKERTKTDKDM